jgi:hypothetical protein
MKIKKNIKIESRKKEKKKRDFGVSKKKTISQSIKILILINMRCSGHIVTGNGRGHKMSQASPAFQGSRSPFS